MLDIAAQGPLEQEAVARLLGITRTGVAFIEGQAAKKLVRRLAVLGIEPERKAVRPARARRDDIVSELVGIGAELVSVDGEGKGSELLRPRR